MGDDDDDKKESSLSGAIQMIGIGTGSWLGIITRPDGHKPVHDLGDIFVKEPICIDDIKKDIGADFRDSDILRKALNTIDLIRLVAESRVFQEIEENKDLEKELVDDVKTAK